MEDWSKYIFDPKKPKDFKAYKLLKKILKDGNAMLVTDMYYFNELFKEEIWTKDVVEELWDNMPDNFNELSSNEKGRVYCDNYSPRDYADRLESKIENISGSNFYQCFSNFFKEFKNFDKSRKTTSNKYHLLGDKKLSSNSVLNFSDFIRTKEFSETSIYSESGCCFIIKEILITKKNRWREYEENFVPFDFFNVLKLSRTSVFFTIESIIEQQDYHKFLNLHPIILKQESDIHALLDFIIRDIKNETREKPTHKPETYLQEITIKNYFSLENVAMKNLGDKKEIYLMGENGDGKTILLQAIALALRGNKNIGAVIDIVKQNPHKSFSLNAITNDKEKYNYQINPKNQKKAFEPLLAYGIERFRNDSDKKDEVGYLSLFNKETYLENPEKWLQHLDYKETKGDLSEISLEQAKEILTDIIGKEDIKITVTPDKVTFTEKGTVLQFDQLSDGYQSVIIWVCDLIARLSVLQPNVSSTHDYSGIVIVDEIGAYLHPKWAYSIVKKLREWFPYLQFIFTTHNPIIILGASEDAAFYKVYKENGKTKVSEPVEDISDLMLNSLVTSPLFNLPSARPKSFDEQNDLSSDDYVYRRIHQAIQQKLQTMPDLVDEDVIKMIEAELEKI
ncbi:MAG: AAA family ATPase [Saprospiraceae bacterium]